jgi:hypothetical protein
MQSPTLEKRFWGKFLVGRPADCWEWTGKKCNWGYGSLWAGDGKLIGAHRLSYILHKGDIPDGMVVQHDCDNPACVNPRHLTLGTHKTNSDDKMRKGRWKPGGSRGEGIANSRLKEADVIQIRAANGTLREIAEQFDVCEGAIWNIRSGRTWAHVS